VKYCIANQTVPLPLPVSISVSASSHIIRYGISSVADPDPHGSAFILISWIRMVKITHKSEENSSFEVPDVLF
jgi:hypothetical protein